MGWMILTHPYTPTYPNHSKKKTGQRTASVTPQSLPAPAVDTPTIHSMFGQMVIRFFYAFASIIV